MTLPSAATITSPRAHKASEAIYRKRRTSIPDKGHKSYPCLLGTVAIERPNQVWAADITYLPMAKGFAYLVAILDLTSRKVLSFRVSNAMSTDFCVEALEEALTRYGAPEIFNTDQPALVGCPGGSQFTAEDFTQPLEARGVRVSMDGKGRWVDNVFVERLWRSVKCEDIYLHAYETVREVKVALASYFSFYNARRAVGRKINHLRIRRGSYTVWQIVSQRYLSSKAMRHLSSASSN